MERTPAEPTEEQRRPPAPRGGRPGRATRRLRPDRPCLNCGDPTPGEFCPRCGQRRVAVQVSVKSLVMDTLEDELTVDRRLPTTLGALLFRPGRLTVEYVNGRIVRYIRPFRLYLLTSVICFLLLSFLSLRFIREALADDPAPRPTVEAAAATADIEQLEADMAAVATALADTATPETARIPLRQERQRLTRELAAARTAAAMDAVERVQGAEPGADTPRVTATTPAPEDRMAFLDNASISIGHPAVDSAIARRIDELRQMAPRQAAERLVGDFIGFIPTVMFVLLPLFALVLKLLYVRRRRFYAEHFVFLLHLHSFVFLLFIVGMLLMMAGWLRGWLVWGLVGWAIVYSYMAMRAVYGQGRFKTFLKWWTLGWAYFWILSFALPFAVITTLILL